MHLLFVLSLCGFAVFDGERRVRGETKVAIVVSDRGTSTTVHR
jgi:hypothetical protein